MMLIVIICAAALVVAWVAIATSAPTLLPTPTPAIVAAPRPTAPPTPLPEALLQAASEKGRKIARMIAASDPTKWEIETDHCHYRGTPSLSFVYPRGASASMGPGLGRTYAFSYPRYAPGLYVGGQDINMYEQPILRNAADEALIMAAVEGVKDRLSAINEQKAKIAREKAARERTAKLDQFMADVEGRV